MEIESARLRRQSRPSSRRNNTTLSTIQECNHSARARSRRGHQAGSYHSDRGPTRIVAQAPLGNGARTRSVTADLFGAGR